MWTHWVWLFPRTPTPAHWPPPCPQTQTQSSRGCTLSRRHSGKAVDRGPGAPGEQGGAGSPRTQACCPRAPGGPHGARAGRGPRPRPPTPVAGVNPGSLPGTQPGRGLCPLVQRRASSLFGGMTNRPGVTSIEQPESGTNQNQEAFPGPLHQVQLSSGSVGRRRLPWVQVSLRPGGGGGE